MICVNSNEYESLYVNLNLSTMWEKAVETSVSSPQAVIHGLIEGNEYQFRVIALNKAGQSEPGEASKTFVAKPRYCKYANKLNRKNKKFY